MKFVLLSCFLVLGVSSRAQPRGARTTLSSGIRGERRRRLQDMNVGGMDDKDKEDGGELDDDDALMNGAMGNMTGFNATMPNMTGVLDEVVLAEEELISVEEEDDKDDKEGKADKADKEDKEDKKDDKDEDEEEVDSEDEAAEAVEADSTEEVNSMEDMDPEYDD